VGEQVFVDQYESNIQGRLPTSHGSEPSLTKYCGGTLFFDAASQLNQIFYQSSLGSSDTLNSKNQFEHEADHCEKRLRLITQTMEFLQKRNFGRL